MAWERLTTKEHDIADPLYYRPLSASYFRHHLVKRGASDRLHFTNPELDALATKSEAWTERESQVRGLVEAYQRLYDICHFLTVRAVIELGDDAIVASGLNPWCLNEGLAKGNERINLDWAQTALAPFEDTTDV